MVKNTTGGSKHKSMARKLVNAPVSNKIRFSEDEDECYAKVVKMLGNGMVHVNLVYKNDLHNNVVCHIRGKFRSRNKKNNLVTIGGTLLVGIRSWSSKLDACDLLCVYNDNQINSLNLPSILFSNSLDHNPIDNETNDISFSNDISNFNNNSIIHSHLQPSLSNDHNDINWDDI
jgi:translation initiation factor IF-1